MVSPAIFLSALLVCLINLNRPLSPVDPGPVVNHSRYSSIYLFVCLSTTFLFNFFLSIYKPYLPGFLAYGPTSGTLRAHLRAYEWAQGPTLRAYGPTRPRAHGPTHPRACVWAYGPTGHVHCDRPMATAPLAQAMGHGLPQVGTEQLNHALTKSNHSILDRYPL